ncbi:hypothetical protein LguiA_026612 [Lonicera macranthoides]
MHRPILSYLKIISLKTTIHLTTLIFIPIMLTLIIFLSSFLHLLTTTIAANNAPPDYFLLNCGTDYNTTSMDGRSWEGNTGFKFALANTESVFTSSKASGQTNSIPQVPHMTALIFQNSTFTYSFPLAPGPKFLRLYFYPAATYSALDKSTSFFNVTANDYTLLKNFNPFFTVSSLKQDSIIKEFVLHVSDRGSLNLTFSPSPNSHAFINGIEIFPIPDNYYIRGSDYQIPNVGQLIPFSIDKTTALEALYRLNVGGNDIQVTEDTGMFRSWVKDDDYLLGGTLGFTPHRNIPIIYTSETPNYSAPDIVYTTARTMNNDSLRYNMTWTFPVDAGFFYLLRLYFCEFQMEFTKINQRTFTIYINNQTAENAADVIGWSSGNGIPVYREYLVRVNDESNNRRSKPDLWLSMSPNMRTSSQYANAILNGLEIFKLNKSDGSLSSPNHELKITTQPPPAPISPAPGKAKSKSMIFAIIGGVLGSITVISILVFFVFWRRRIVKSYAKSSHEPSGLCRRFSLADIKSATRNFDENLVIGKGGFGNVYKGYIDDGVTAVAIKRLNPTSNQGVREFETEIELLSKLRHVHLVSLIGYCDENGEMVLVYDYMANGTLRDHLYKTKKSPLTWKQRLQICIGSARGLHYLHMGVKPMIIHRDIKPTNILLDEKFVAKVSDFGLSKMGPANVSHTHVSTAVKGSFGYLDPEYYKRLQLTDKSDVYSFGVVLFEVLCGRPAIIPELPWEQVNLAEWAKKSYKKGKLKKIIDPHLKGEIAPECLAKFGEIAYSCLRDQGIERPRMNDIVWNLESVLQLQELADKMEQNGNASETRDNNHAHSGFHEDAIKTDDDTDSGSIEGGVSNLERNGTLSIPSDYKFKSQLIFSEIINPAGR